MKLNKFYTYSKTFYPSESENQTVMRKMVLKR